VDYDAACTRPHLPRGRRPRGPTQHTKR